MRGKGLRADAEGMGMPEARLSGAKALQGQKLGSFAANLSPEGKFEQKGAKDAKLRKRERGT
jgi:hypothetical protein